VVDTLLRRYNGAEIYFEQDWFFVSESSHKKPVGAHRLMAKAEPKRIESTTRRGMSKRGARPPTEEDLDAESLKYSKTMIQLTTLPYASTDADAVQQQSKSRSEDRHESAYKVNQQGVWTIKVGACCGLHHQFHPSSA